MSCPDADNLSASTIFNLKVTKLAKYSCETPKS